MSGIHASPAIVHAQPVPQKSHLLEFLPVSVVPSHATLNSHSALNKSRNLPSPHPLQQLGLLVPTPIVFTKQQRSRSTPRSARQACCTAQMNSPCICEADGEFGKARNKAELRRILLSCHIALFTPIFTVSTVVTDISSRPTTIGSVLPSI